MVEFLLDCGVDAPVHIVKGMSPLHVACTAGHIHVIKILLQVSKNITVIVEIEQKMYRQSDEKTVVHIQTALLFIMHRVMQVETITQ